ncbi:MAG TPA: hypothetical protein VLF89_01660 [Candidatus Saccharimonadales bacterium]|nr:hypothetical protein [Candidatus Saccharimonadales bacterium]
MRYKVTKRRYIDSIFILLIGSVCIIALSFFIKPPATYKKVISKPTVSINPNNRFVYIINTNQNNTINIFDMITGKNDAVSTNSAQNITTVSLFYNHLLYLHGDTNIGINIDTKKTFANNGDYRAPDGKRYLSLEESPYGLLNFSLIDENNDKTLIKTPTIRSHIDKVLGWSPDSNNFYYTVPYSITKQASMSATDTWMQKVGKEMKEMSRVRTWMKSTTTSAEMVFRVNIQTKTTDKIFTKGNFGTIRNAFYNNDRDEFYITNDTGFYRTDLNERIITPIPLSLKTITSMVFATQDTTDRFLHTNGTSLSLADPIKGTDQGLFYASNSAIVTPLALTGNKVIFSLREKDHFAGEILDLTKKTRTEFGYTNDLLTATSSAKPIIFGAWVKNISVTF